MDNGGSILAFEDVQFSRGTRFTLGPLTLRVQPGQVLSLLGPNGAGKSTLLQLATGALGAARGQVCLLGTDPARASRRWIAQRVAVLPQQLHAPFSISVEEIVTQGRWPHLKGLRLGGCRDKEIVTQALHRARVEHLATRNVQTLSGGERQRVLLAKALAQEPKVLLLDEPTASLDPGHISAVLGPLVHAAREVDLTLLMATHDVNLAAALSDRVVMLKNGAVLASGVPSEVVREDLLGELYDATLHVTSDAGEAGPRVWLDF